MYSLPKMVGLNNNIRYPETALSASSSHLLTVHCAIAKILELPGAGMFIGEIRRKKSRMHG